MSIAHHALLVAKVVDRRLSTVMSELYRKQVVLYALHHDDSEAFTGDMVTPLKRAPGFEGFRRVEDGIQSKCWEKFCGLWPWREEALAAAKGLIRHADVSVLLAERRDLLAHHVPWDNEYDVPPYPNEIVPMLPAEAERVFLEAHKWLEQEHSNPNFGFPFC